MLKNAVSSLNSIRGVLTSCNRSLRPSYFDDDWEEPFRRVEIDCVSGGIIKASADPQEAFDKLVSATYPDSVRIFTDGSVDPTNDRVGSAFCVPAMDYNFDLPL